MMVFFDEIKEKNSSHICCMIVAYLWANNGHLYSYSIVNVLDMNFYIYIYIWTMNNWTCCFFVIIMHNWISIATFFGISIESLYLSFQLVFHHERWMFLWLIIIHVHSYVMFKMDIWPTLLHMLEKIVPFFIFVNA